jgi:hypothetical protein
MNRNGMNGNAMNMNDGSRGRGNARGNDAAVGNRGNDRAPSDLNTRSNSSGQNAGTSRNGAQSGQSANAGAQNNGPAGIADNENTSNNSSANGNNPGGTTRRPITGFNADGSSMSGGASTSSTTGTPNSAGVSNATAGLNTGGATTGTNAFRGQQTTGSNFSGRTGTLEAQQAFSNSFNRMLDSILTDPQQRTRFMQLQSQFRGFDSLSDPAVQQQLNMTDQQSQQIARAREEWLDQMNQIANLPPEQRNAAQQRFNLLRQRFVDRINQTLTTPEQRRAWLQMFGEPYEFGFDAYFGSDPSLGGQTQSLGTPTNPSSLEVGAEAGETTSSIRGAGSANSPLGAGSNIGTSANPTPGTDAGTGGNTGTNIGTGSNR